MFNDTGLNTQRFGKKKYYNSITRFKFCLSLYPYRNSPPLPLIATEYHAYNSVSSVESVKLLTIIEAKMGQNGRRSKCATFY